MQTTSFQVTGGRPLNGQISPKGAKNEALQVICAPLLTSEKVTISNTHVEVVHTYNLVLPIDFNGK